MNSIAFELNKFFSEQRRYVFPFHAHKNEISRNGIYIIFEIGETYKNFDRIVRVGTHTGNNQLYSRLNQHFVKENKNRSIFRKNIGRCILNKAGNPYLQTWEFDATSAEGKRMYEKMIDVELEKQIEKIITRYIQANLSFCVLKVDDKQQRLFWEAKIASTLAQSKELKPSPGWLGYYSPKEKIRTSGLWQVNELNGESLKEHEFELLKGLTNMLLIHFF
jgi:hypothetical protein